jgi:RHS repeat-associated protein
MELATINNACLSLPRKSRAAGNVWLFVGAANGAINNLLYCFLLMALCLGSASSDANTPPPGQLVASFVYNPSGLRIEKQGERGVERFTYDEQSLLQAYDENNTTLAKYDYGAERLVSLTSSSEPVQFYLTDALNSVVNLTNTAGSVQARYQYDAFGNQRAQSGSSYNRFAFTGYVEDKETDLLYAKARYYDSDTGRFLSQDAWEGQNDLPPSLHKYLYAYQNPTVYVDYSGNNPVSPMDWLSFAQDVGGLMVQEAVYVAATINKNEAVANLALEGMKEARLDAAVSTAGLINPVPGTSKVYKTMKMADKLEGALKSADKANDLRKMEDKANDVRKIEDKVSKTAQAKTEARVTKESDSSVSPRNEDHKQLKSLTSSPISDPARLLTAPKKSTPELADSPIESDLLPAGFRYKQVVSPGQKNPGKFGTTDEIQDVKYAREELAITPAFKEELSGVREVEVIRSVRAQKSTVGPQEYGGVTAKGGGSQIEVLEYSKEDPFLKFVGDEKPFN